MVSGMYHRARIALLRPLMKIGNSIRAGLEKYFATKVERAPAGSIHLLIWGLLANTILKSRLLDHYARRLDYTKRLVSVRASQRFLGTLENHNLKSFIEGLKRDHEVDFVYCWHALLGEFYQPCE